MFGHMSSYLTIKNISLKKKKKKSGFTFPVCDYEKCHGLVKVTTSGSQVSSPEESASPPVCPGTIFLTGPFSWPPRPGSCSPWIAVNPPRPQVRALEKCGLWRQHGAHDERKRARMATISPRMPTSQGKEPHLPTECHYHRETCFSETPSSQGKKYHFP